MSVNVVTVVQARTGSTRLPGKVLLPLAGMPALAVQLRRLSASRLAGTVVVATTERVADDSVVELAADRGVPVFRGSEIDLVDRHLGAGSAFAADVVVKIPSDCPLIDPVVVDRVIGTYLDSPDRFDFVSNLHPPSWPDGQDVEVIPIEILATVDREAQASWEREHTTPFIWERPDRFRIGNVSWDRDCSRSHRLTLDYAEDAALLEAVLTALGPDRPIEEIVAYLDDHPRVAELNARLRGVNWYRHHLTDLRTITSDMVMTEVTA